MKISAISANYQQQKATHTNFKGVFQTVSENLLQKHNNGEQGIISIYERIVEYRPYLNETLAEIKSAMEKFPKTESFVNKHNFDESIYNIKLVLGKTIDSTKEAAEFIIKHHNKV